MLTLAIETSTPHGSVALWDGAAVIFDDRFTADRGHSALLFPRVQAALRSVAQKPELIAVGLGPGSYAGIRMGIASALGLQMALGSRLIGIPSVAAFESMPERHIVVGDARRATFYWTELNGGLCVDGPLLLGEEELHARLAANTLPVYSSDSDRLTFPTTLGFPSAARLAQIAASGTDPNRELEPIYLREAHITQPKR